MRMNLALCCLVLAASACGDDDADAAGLSVTLVVGSTGGTVELANGGKVEVPAGALNEEISIKITELKPTDVAKMPNNVEASGKPYAFEPHGQQFAMPVKVTVPFDGAVTEVRPFKLEDESDTTWTMVTEETKETGKITISTTTFSVYQPARPRRDTGVVMLPDSGTVDASAPDATVMQDASTGGAVGAPCTADSDCRTELFCFMEAPEPACAVPCTSDADCAEGVCYAEFGLCITLADCMRNCSPPGTCNARNLCSSPSQ